MAKHGKSQRAAWAFMDANAPKRVLRVYVDIADHEKALATYFHSGLFADVAEIAALLERCSNSESVLFCSL